MFTRTPLPAAAALTIINTGIQSADALASGNAAGSTATKAITPEAACLQRLESSDPVLLRSNLPRCEQQAQPESDNQPETMRADALLAPIVLPQTLALLDQAMAGAPTAMLGLLQTARRGFADAQKELHAGSRDDSQMFMVGVLQSMAQGQTAMGEALDLALVMHPTQVTLLLREVQKVRMTGRRHVAQMADLALAAGATSARLEPAMAALRAGDALHAAGNDGGAVSQYALGFGLAANTVIFIMDRFQQNLISVFDTETVG